MNAIRRSAGLAIVLIAVGAMGASPALAKGPTRAVIRGPGIDEPIVLTWRGGSADRFGDLVKRSGIFNGLWCRTCRASAGTRPTGALGPRFTIAYTLAIETIHHIHADRVIQDVYPYADPRPVTFVRRGQPFYGEETVGGWFVARPSLRGVLHQLGVPAVAPDEPDASPSVVASTIGSSGAGNGRPWAPIIVVAAAGTVTVVVVRRRSRSAGRDPREADVGSVQD